MAYNGYPGTYQNYATRYVEVVPVDTEEEVDRAQVAFGGTALFTARDNRFLAVKSVDLTGGPTVDYYDRRPPAPKPKPFDPNEYIRKDELMGIIASIQKREEPVNESV